MPRLRHAATIDRHGWIPTFWLPAAHDSSVDSQTSAALQTFRRTLTLSNGAGKGGDLRGRLKPLPQRTTPR